MDKIIIEKIIKVTNSINERFNNLTIDEFADLQAGDGTLSILDDVIKYYEEQGYTFNCREITVFADYVINIGSEYYHAHEFDDLTEEHKAKLFKDFDSIADGFAEMCADQGIDYDDQDEWLEWLKGFEGDDLTYHEIRYINTLWTDENKERYRRVETDDMPYCTRLAEKCAQRLSRNKAQK